MTWDVFGWWRESSTEAEIFKVPQKGNNEIICQKNCSYERMNDFCIYLSIKKYANSVCGAKN
jgi:hypothetical protein